MNTEIKDKGLRKALNDETPVFLPGNFAYRTMLKIEEAMILQAKRSERRMLWVTILMSVLLIGGCIAMLLIFFEKSAHTIRQSLMIPFSPLYILLILVPILLFFDRWIRKRYFKHHA